MSRRLSTRERAEIARLDALSRADRQRREARQAELETEWAEYRAHAAARLPEHVVPLNLPEHEAQRRMAAGTRWMKSADRKPARTPTSRVDELLAKMDESRPT